jgi:Leucine-rich repeat (LRR) protein
MTKEQSERIKLLYDGLEDDSIDPNLTIYLQLSGVNLTEIPPMIYKKVNLKYLDLSQNLIEVVAARISVFEKLEHLDLSNNKLTSLPPEIGNLQKLSVLDLRHNSISPEEEEKIKQLLPNCKRIYFT